MKIRIECKAPKQPDDPSFGIAASWPDMRVFAVNDDGSEIPLTNVTSVRFECEAGLEPARATLTFADVELDVETESSCQDDEQCKSSSPATSPR